MKEIYASHSAECADGIDCIAMAVLKRDIEDLEHEIEVSAKARSAAVK